MGEAVPFLCVGVIVGVVNCRPGGGKDKGRRENASDWASMTYWPVHCSVGFTPRQCPTIELDRSLFLPCHHLAIRPSTS